ncbi:MAG: protocatechuate 3,4-dioxygenase beta subunit [Gammaproteobacteria bacterium]|jgi:protocatechuate 3,4-dioxygenase beta subunit
MDNPVKQARRKLLLGMLTLPISGLARAAISTPSATEGPFYPTTAMRFEDIDNDLVKITGEVEQAGGEVVKLGGRVLDESAKPIAGARVEIWQCDVKGRYLHRGDSGGDSRDPAFQGFGHDLTDVDGHYSFRTIKPVPYSGRTPHIHVKVLVNNRQQLTTQFYLPDHPDNKRDWLYRQIPQAKRELVTLNFKSTQSEPLAILDIII